MNAAARAAQQTGDRTRVDELSAAVGQATRNVAALNRQFRATAPAISAATRATAGLAAMNKEVAALGGSFTTMADRVLPQWRTVFTLSVGAAAIALGKLATSAAHSLDDLDDLAKATGTTTQQIESLQLVAAKSGEAGFENINKALERTTRAMGLAQIEYEKTQNVISAGGMKRDFSDPFKAVLLDPSDFKDSISLLEEWAKRVEQIREPAIRAAVASDLLGKGWARQLPILQNLRAEMEAAQREIEAGGGFTSEQTIEQGNKFIAVMARLEALFTRLRNVAGAQLGEALLPVLRQLTAFFEQNAEAIKIWTANAAGYISALTQDLIKFFVLGQPGQQTEWGASIINALIYIQNTLIPGVTAAFQTVMGVLDQVAAGINSIFGTNLTGADVGIALAIGQISGAFNVLATALTAVAAIVAVGAPLAAALSPAGWIIAGCVAVNAAVITLTGSWGALGDAVVSAGQQIADGLSSAWGWLKKIGGQIAGMPAPAGATPGGFAMGGRVPGAGTGDTVPAWLTPGEYVARRASVDYYGARLFAALNARRIPRESFSRYGFAMGGMVGAPMSFADGGEVGGGRPVHLHLDGNSFALSGAPSVVDALVTAAHRQHVRSAGVKPSWYGGR